MNAPVRWRTTNMTSKGQILIPKDVRDALGLVPGEPVQIGVQDGGGAAMVRREPSGDEAPRERQARILAALDRGRAVHRTGRTTEEIMHFLRGDEPLP